MTDLLPTLLIVDDEKHTRDGLRRALEDHFEIYVAGDENSAYSLMESEKIDVVLTDLRLGADNGMKVLQKARTLQPAPICVMMTAYGSVENAVESMRQGAYDYVTKPVNIDKLEMLLLRALRSRQVETENKQLRQQLDDKFGLEMLIGRSSQMVQIYELIKQVADSRASVLIEGESGTGKELVAQAIHALSARKLNPFIPVHCAALSAQLFESELFGHEKGAFTGAQERRIGRFEQANKGTIFLDEIGEIDEATQVKLLRVLGERCFERVGGNKKIEVDVRLISATNKNLEQLVQSGDFREDLYYRVNVVKVVLPPLRERKEDIALLANSFLKDFSKENKKRELQFSKSAEEALIHYEWPGNVRELKAAIEHGVVLARGKEIMTADLPPALRKVAQLTINPNHNKLNLQQMEKVSIISALEECNNNRTDAAKLLGISRRTLHRKIHEYQLT